MSGNDSLTPKQEKFIACLVSGQTIVAAAKVAGVSEKTAHAWLKQETVKNAYRDAKQHVFDDALATLKDNIEAAIKSIKLLALDKETPAAVRLRASQIWLETAITVYEKSEIEQKFLLLEQMVKDRAA